MPARVSNPLRIVNTSCYENDLYRFSAHFCFVFFSLLQETMSKCCQLFKHFMETIKHVYMHSI